MMPSRRRCLVASLGVPLAAWCSAAAAADLADRDARQVRQVVESQLQAMADGDGDKAFSYASAAIRAQFGNAARFMAMVLGAYPMVVRPAATVFYRATSARDGQAQQVVQLRDAQGGLWRATYLLMRPADGHWRIAGCVVAPDSPVNST